MALGKPEEGRKEGRKGGREEGREEGREGGRREEDGNMAEALKMSAPHAYRISRGQLQSTSRSCVLLCQRSIGLHHALLRHHPPYVG